MDIKYIRDEEVEITCTIGELWTMFNAYDHNRDNLHPIGADCFETIAGFLKAIDPEEFY